MRTDKNAAIKLRREGKSYSEIKAILGVPKGTLSDWLTDDMTSQMVCSELAIKARKKNGEKLGKLSHDKWNAYRQEASKEALRQFPELQNNPLFVAGVMLYWGEGDKKPKGQLRFTNTEAQMVRIYVTFLETIMGIPRERVKAALILYPDLSESECKFFWIENIKLPMENFIKTQFILGRHPTKRLPHGICMIYVSDIYQKTKMLAWIDIFFRQYIITP